MENSTDYRAIKKVWKPILRKPEEPLPPGLTGKTVRVTPKSALVLEGGGMRGVFTCGVLDNLMDRGIYFPYVIGVSAGACNGLSYMSRQRGRAKYSNIEMLERYKYIGFKYLLTQRNLMDFHLLFEEFPERILPYDYEAYARSKERYVMVATNCRTGKATYLEEKDDPKRIIDIARASCSLPFVCPIAYVDDIPMLDGGIADSIPLLHAREEGYTDNLVILTRNQGYRKKLHGTKVPPFIYHKYPKLQAAINERSRLYNRQLDYVEELEQADEATVIRPIRPMEVGRMERNTCKLLMLYEEGYQCADAINFIDCSAQCTEPCSNL